MTAELALTRPDPTMNEASLRVMMAAAQRYVDSGLLPDGVNTPQKALVIMTAGRELGVPATYALRNIHVVKGKPTCSAELMLALVRRAYGPSAIRVAKSDNQSCTVQYREQGWDGVSEYTFTMDDARAAGVANSTTWKSFPAAMLRARCISAVVRFAFPECISGLYTPEELGAQVSVTEEGAVIDVRSVSAPVVKDETDEDRAQIQEEWGTASPPCNVKQYNAHWHAAVKGTRFEQDDIRHKFVSHHTGGKTESLKDFLATATEDEAAALIVAVEKRIDHEARKARADLEAQLLAVIEEANAAGGSFQQPENMGEQSDDQITALIASIEDVLEKASAA